MAAGLGARRYRRDRDGDEGNAATPSYRQEGAKSIMHGGVPGPSDKRAVACAWRVLGWASASRADSH